MLTMLIVRLCIFADLVAEAIQFYAKAYTPCGAKFDIDGVVERFFLSQIPHGELL